MENEQKKSPIADILNLFIGNDDRRPVFNKPFEVNGKVYATDAHVLIRTDKKNIDFIIDNEHLPPKVEQVIPERNLNEILNINKEMFESLKTADEYEFSGKDIDCKTCDGHGEVEWEFEHYTHDFDCPVCNGSGLSEERRGKKTGGKTFGDSIVKLKDAYFRVRLFYKLIEVKDRAGGDVYLTGYKDKRSGVLFKIGDYEIVIMPLLIEDESEYEGVLNLNNDQPTHNTTN
jgi:hypothetical protein